jgi:alpha-D-ribose 1-methylphosphonate 5-triphosphate diphosphatase PhnM
MATVSAAPAGARGLRADCLRVKMHGALPVPCVTYRAGRRIA